MIRSPRATLRGATCRLTAITGNGWCSVRSCSRCLFFAVSAAALLSLQQASAHGKDSRVVGIDSGDAFASLLDETADGDFKDRVAMLSVAADLEKYAPQPPNPHSPYVYFKAPARPNSIGLVDVDYGVAVGRIDPERTPLRLRFNFSERDADPARCAQFEETRRALGLNADNAPQRSPTGREERYRVDDRRESARADVVVSTNGLVAPCLRTAWIRFHSQGDVERGTGFDSSALQEFVGNAEGDYFGRGMEPLNRPLLVALRMPDHLTDASRRDPSLPGGYALTNGCRRYHCADKAAVIADREGHIVRAALIAKCDSDDRGCRRVLTIFKNPAKLGGQGDQELLDEALLVWARARVPEVRVASIELPSAP